MVLLHTGSVRTEEREMFRIFVCATRRHDWPNYTQIRGKVEAHVPASMVLARVVAAVMPTSGRAVMLAITLLAFGNSAHATCDADGFISGANGPIVLGTAG